MADLKTSQEELLTELSGDELVRVSVPSSDGYDSAAAPASLFLAAVGSGLQGLTFTSDTGSTADSDPGNGLFKWNNVTQASATVLYFDSLTADGVSITTFLDSLGPNSTLFLQQSDDATKWQSWRLTGVSISASGYRKLPVEFLGSGGSIADDKTVFCDFDSAGQLTSAPTFSTTPTLNTTYADVIYFGALTANVTAFNLSGTRPKVVVCFVQDGTGGRTVAAGSSIDFGTDIPDLSGIASGISAYTYVGFIYNPTTAKFRVVALSK